MTSAIIFPSDSFRPCGHLYYSIFEEANGRYTHVTAPLGSRVWRTSKPRFPFFSDLLIPGGWAPLQPIDMTSRVDRFSDNLDFLFSLFHIALGFQFNFPSPCLWRALAYVSDEKKLTLKLIKDCRQSRLGTTTCMLFCTHWNRARA